MSIFDDLRAGCPGEWAAYVEHDFVRTLGEGTLPEAAFRDYLIQDYLFLVQFARAHALAAYKSQTLLDLRGAHTAMGAILDEIPLHEKLCARWGLGTTDLAEAVEKAGTVAYTRYVLDVGASGDLLDLNVALAPCIIGYAEIGSSLAPRLEQLPDHPYGEWIAEYAGDAYQSSAVEARCRLDELADVGLTEQRKERLARIFRTATQCESAFWQSALDSLN